MSATSTTLVAIQPTTNPVPVAEIATTVVDAVSTSASTWNRRARRSPRSDREANDCTISPTRVVSVIRIAPTRSAARPTIAPASSPVATTLMGPSTPTATSVTAAAAKATALAMMAMRAATAAADRNTTSASAATSGTAGTATRTPDIAGTLIHEVSIHTT